MNKINDTFNYFGSIFLSHKTKEKSEKIIVFIAIFSFAIHLALIMLSKLHVIVLDDYSMLLNNPIAAIYTPFSFILVYEVYLLVYYLPKSTSIYIGKQYEIISLIVIRRIFKDLSNLEFVTNWFENKNDVLLLLDLLTIIALFFLIFIFYKLSNQNELKREKQLQPEIVKFIQLKKNIATLLIPILLILSFYSFGNWIFENFFSLQKMVSHIKDINKIFFDDFFTILILIDVLLLLISFLHSDNFSKVIRNSGFIISTIILKLSFGTEGILNTILVIIAVSFGVVILKIHNNYVNLENKKAIN